MKQFFGPANWRDDSDWQSAFEYASNVTASHDCAPNPFTIDDVALPMAAEAGENDGDQWIMVGLLNDGRYFFLTAGCDYTGWDCQAGGHSAVADTFEGVCRWGMGDDDRIRLGINLEELT